MARKTGHGRTNGATAEASNRASDGNRAVAGTDREKLTKFIETHVTNQKTRKTCKNILKIEPGLWIFVNQDGVEPTNNAAERALRRGVIWRRRSFGTQSEQGSRFVGRILTVVISLRQQNRDVLDFLTQACSPNHPTPSLLPVTN